MIKSISTVPGSSLCHIQTTLHRSYGSRQHIGRVHARFPACTIEGHLQVGRRHTGLISPTPFGLNARTGLRTLYYRPTFDFICASQLCATTTTLGPSALGSHSVLTSCYWPEWRLPPAYQMAVPAHSTIGVLPRVSMWGWRRFSPDPHPSLSND